MPIEIDGLGKSYGGRPVVADLSFRAADGRVTGFLGPNGAGKSTTLRCLLGLARPDVGTALIDGRPYAALPAPARRVGAALDPTAHHPDRRGRDHLRMLALASELPRGRVDEVLRLVELDDAADRRAGDYSLGMRQRLHLAAALLGDPAVLVLDEPANGLDPQGIRWLRDSLRGFAAEGRCVLLSSHQLGEVAQTVDDVVVISGGRLVAAGTLAAVLADRGSTVRLRSPDAAALVGQLTLRGGEVRRGGDLLEVSGLAQEAVARAAFEAGALVLELAATGEDLEERFLELTAKAA